LADAAELDLLVNRLAGKLTVLNLRLSTAESCTGGGIGHALTSVSGSSLWYLGGVIAYSNSLKSELLNVSLTTIEKFGAVSEETARLMAIGASEVTHSDISISTTGIAGPAGGTEDKPVGTVCFGWSISGNVHTETVLFKGDRDSVREQSVYHAIKYLVEGI